MFLAKKGLLSVIGHSFIFASFCEEYFAVHGEHADRHKIERISTNFRRKPKKIQFLSNLLRHDQMGKKPSHATVPLTPVFVASLRYSWLFGFCISMVPFLLLIKHCSEYWIIHRGPCFLVVEWFGSSATPYTPLSSVSSAGDTQEECERETSLLTGGGGVKGAGVEPNHPTARKAGPL